MLAHPGTGLVVRGHASAVGDDQGNLLLSYQRALAVRSVLVGLGVPESTLLVRAAGALEPVTADPAGCDQPASRRSRFRRLRGVMIVAIVVAAVGAVVPFAAGYLFGAARCRRPRRPREQVIDLTGTARRRDDVVERRAAQDEALRADLQRVLAPLLERERLTDELG
ncbi:MAG: OmpA family protein [Acidimicrobiales bacterium]